MEEQPELSKYLEKINKTVDTIQITEPISGDVDLSIFQENGFNNLKNIEFKNTDKDGEYITSITNIPDGIESLTIVNHSLSILPELPKSLLSLNVFGNYLKNIDLITAPNLKFLYCENNRVETITNIPRSLEELYINNNKLKTLDLSDAKNLKKLHCSDNQSLIIENIPKSINELICERSPNVKTITNEGDQIATDASRVKFNYVEGVNEYYKIKGKYDKDLHEMREKIYKRSREDGLSITKSKKNADKVKMKCINCKLPVGTIFSNKNSRYTAVCGNKIQPCSLNIEIYRGSIIGLEDIMYTLKESVDEVKENIIRQKMNTLFSYISEEDSVREFKTIMEQYTTESDMYGDYLDKYNKLYFGEIKNEIIREKQDLINEIGNTIKGFILEYKKTNSIDSLKSAMDAYVNELLPQLSILTNIKYDIIEMNEFILIQTEVEPSKTEISSGENPNIIHFTKVKT